MPCSESVLNIAANHEKDTCFGNGLVMGSADCVNYAGLVKTLEKLFKCKLGPLPDTMQAGLYFPAFLKIRVNMSCAFGYLVTSFQVPQKTGRHYGAIYGTP